MSHPTRRLSPNKPLSRSQQKRLRKQKKQQQRQETSDSLFLLNIGNQLIIIDGELLANQAQGR